MFSLVFSNFSAPLGPEEKVGVNVCLFVCVCMYPHIFYYLVMFFIKNRILFLLPISKMEITISLYQPQICCKEKICSMHESILHFQEEKQLIIKIMLAYYFNIYIQMVIT